MTMKMQEPFAQGNFNQNRHLPTCQATMITLGLPMNIKGSKKRAKVTGRKRKAASSDVADAKLCEEVLPELVRILEAPDTKWLSYDKKLDATLARWSVRKPCERLPHRK